MPDELMMLPALLHNEKEVGKSCGGKVVVK